MLLALAQLSLAEQLCSLRHLYNFLDSGLDGHMLQGSRLRFFFFFFPAGNSDDLNTAPFICSPLIF